MEKKKQYLPTLLERLLDDEPKSVRERFDQSHLDSRAMRAIVQKDIVNLLNHTNVEDRLVEEKHQLIAESVINYGISALIGTFENHRNWNVIEKVVRNAILRFEPRIIPESLLVRSLQEKEHLARNALILFEIRGFIYWEPYPIDLCMHGRYDTESGSMDLKLL
ncbi:type VI secretion system baseplate subunit TssE [Enterobacillus tribolii]|uniref:Type VI secretion system protein ImpF n=1 Tax=Enterobacillus tribolii TaxID=1487935 RepID=A0A370Q4T2_9GAMM|nr:GPW/gp25 family protein [Enterobacillus tribolii]MBW7985081.1 type VI secretion system baseplate subunit TssE [Enterobacillus tribolii]RDK83309.1 type VI secretion system protein ImpF [Enterobacillus tribolii]